MSGHRGVDLAGPGEEVHSPAAGTVVFAGRVVDRSVVTVDHGGGLRSSFEPVVASVAVGTAVARGQAIGTLESSPGHCPAAPCLHWGVRRGDGYTDPLQFIEDRRPSVLLPWAVPTPGRSSEGLRGLLGQTIAEMPVAARPVTRVLISWVPS
ncbi:hypothetical protein GCM10028789_13460 [Sinomonas halotolerans]